jgi:muramoyltetrapeptide carboxypeptidase
MTNVMDTELNFGESIEEIILNHVAPYRYPVVFKFPSGHENPNLAWRSGATYMLISAADKVELILRS